MPETQHFILKFDRIAPTLQLCEKNKKCKELILNVGQFLIGAIVSILLNNMHLVWETGFASEM